MNKFNYKDKYTVWVPDLEPDKNYDPINVLGIVSWLWMNSQLHSNWSVKMLNVNVLPAIENNQFSSYFKTVFLMHFVHGLFLVILLN
jgi:hemolysin-activating ACP:hemolysin acyltransferase